MRQGLYTTSSRSARLETVLLATVAALVFGPLRAGAVDITAGFDGAIAQAGTRIAIGPLPAGFFGPGSDPFSQTDVAFEGDPSASGQDGDPGIEFTWPPGNCLEKSGGGFSLCISMIKNMTPSTPVDTLIERLEDGSVTPGQPVADIDIEIVELSLKSVDPITVDFNGGATSKDYDVHVDLDGVQTGGTITLTATSFTAGDEIATGTTVVDVNIGYSIYFEEVGNPSNNMTIGGLNGDFDAEGEFRAGELWIPTLSEWGLIAFGMLLLTAMALALWRRRAA
jgi:hypothetical protein